MARMVARAATLAELGAFLLCLVGFALAGGPGVEARVVESTVDVEEVASEGDDEDGVVSRPKSRKRGEASAAPGRTFSEPEREIGSGSGALGTPSLPRVVAPSPSAMAVSEGSRSSFAQIFLAPVRPRGPTTTGSIH